MSLTQTYHTKNLTELPVKRKVNRSKQNSTFVQWITDQDGESYLFKKAEGWTQHTDVSEVLISYICNEKVGIPCVRSSFANDILPSGKKVDGVLVQSYLTPDVVHKINLRDISDSYCKKTKQDSAWFTDLIYSKDAVQMLSAVFKGKIDPHIETQLGLIALSDFLFGQRDRKHYNLEFLVKKQNGEKVLSSTPMMDNGLTFLIEKLNHTDPGYSQNLVSKLYSLTEKESVGIEDKLKIYNEFFAGGDCKFRIGSQSDGMAMGVKDHHLVSLAKSILTNPSIQAAYNQFMAIDSKQLLREFEQKANKKVPESVGLLFETVFDSTRHILKEQVNKLKPRLEEYISAEKRIEQNAPYFLQNLNQFGGLKNVTDWKQIPHQKIENYNDLFRGYAQQMYRYSMGENQSAPNLQTYIGNLSLYEKFPQKRVQVLKKPEQNLGM